MIDYLQDVFASINGILEQLQHEAELKSDETQAETALTLSRFYDELLVLENELRMKF